MAKKKSQKSLKNWGDQDWDYVSEGDKKKPKKKRGRYLPKSVRSGLSASQKAATNRKKRKAGGVGSRAKYSKKVAKKVSSVSKMELLLKAPQLAEGVLSSSSIDPATGVQTTITRGKAGKEPRVKQRQVREPKRTMPDIKRNERDIDPGFYYDPREDNRRPEYKPPYMPRYPREDNRRPMPMPRYPREDFRRPMPMPRYPRDIQEYKDLIELKNKKNLTKLLKYLSN